MKTILYSTFILLVCFSFTQCRKHDTTNNTTTNTDTTITGTQFEINTQNELVFEHSDEAEIYVSLTTTSSSEFQVWVDAFDSSQGYTYTPNQFLLSPNESRKFDITFDQEGQIPSNTQFKIIVKSLNSDSVLKTKTVNLKYAPSCAYNYSHYTEGNITYDATGTQENKTVTCKYRTDANLEVTGLMGSNIILKVDCNNNTVSMIPFTAFGMQFTATGYVTNGIIHLDIYTQGNHTATANILP